MLSHLTCYAELFGQIPGSTHFGYFGCIPVPFKPKASAALRRADAKHVSAFAASLGHPAPGQWVQGHCCHSHPAQSAPGG